jgi:hypothetical protein
MPNEPIIQSVAARRKGGCLAPRRVRVLKHPGYGPSVAPRRGNVRDRRGGRSGGMHGRNLRTSRSIGMHAHILRTSRSDGWMVAEGVDPRTRAHVPDHHPPSLRDGRGDVWRLAPSVALVTVRG